MNTTTHVLVGAALLGRQGNAARTVAAMLGGLAPDLPIVVLIVVAQLFQGASQDAIFGGLYLSPTWQAVIGPSHSVFVWLTVWAVAIAISSAPTATLASAALLHLAMDIPFHHGDAHRHFWPISDWRYMSPISYWDPAYHGLIVAAAEAALAVAATAYLLFRHKTTMIRVVSVGVLALYVARSIYFRATMGHY